MADADPLAAVKELIDRSERRLRADLHEGLEWMLKEMNTLRPEKVEKQEQKDFREEVKKSLQQWVDQKIAPIDRLASELKGLRRQVRLVDARVTRLATPTRMRGKKATNTTAIFAAVRDSRLDWVDPADEALLQIAEARKRAEEEGEHDDE